MAQITIELNDSKVDDFREAFLKLYPKPKSVSFEHWVKSWIIHKLKNAYRTGKVEIIKEGIISEDILY